MNGESAATAAAHLTVGVTLVE